MLILIVVGFSAGVITSISPCVLPVLPIVLTASADRKSLAAPAAEPGAAVPDGAAEPGPEQRRKRRRPYGVVLGLVVSFSAATLFGSLLLSALHLPQDLLRDAGIAVLLIIGLSLLIPRLADLLERPFSRLPRRAVNPDSSGFVLGLGLGLVFVPCAGPVLATIAVVGASHHIGFGAVVLTIAFGLGAGAPLLILALAGDALVRRTSVLRRRARTVRITSGIVMVLVAAAIGLNLTDGLQRHVPGYTTALQNHVEQNATAAGQLRKLTTNNADGPGAKVAEAGSNNGDDGSSRAASGSADEGQCTDGGAALENCGVAPALTGINGWLNTAHDQPLTLSSLRGKVVLIDFWTYSCINCQRTLPHLEAWYSSYDKDGFEIIGVHTPEFASEHVTSNVRSQAASLGVTYPIAIDNDYATWNAYSNQYWPAEYLIDSTGLIRHVSFGEGDYSGTESLIRQLLTTAHPGVALPAATDVPNTTPTEAQSPETYLGYKYPLSISGQALAHDRAESYRFPSTIDPDTYALAGTWTAGSEALTAGAGAKLEISYQAKDVYLVIGGTGTVTVQTNGVADDVVPVAGVPKLYTLVHSATASRAVLTLLVSPGVQAYDFTFG